MSWALTLARPAAKLAKTRPTARLLGVETVVSVLGSIIINAIFTLLTIGFLNSQSFYRCHEFDGSNVDLRRWWELADNYESAVTSILIMYQILHSAAAFNLGKAYRQGGLSNKIFILCYIIVFSVISYVLLADPNPLGCLYHINCGNAASLVGYQVPFNAPTLYHSDIGHNVLPNSFRWILFGISLINLGALLAWEGLVVLGPIRSWVRSKWGKQESLTL